ncbi:MAG: hypothetical protein CM15mP69_4430 [Ectothiorhodospiraceae bacterium]|nr:MAG: hypothetical protein CM15mP69_4430 [Ectothiorhodospiraceae bacterium]
MKIITYTTLEITEKISGFRYMRLLLSIFISFIVTPVSFAGTDLTGKTLICETIDDEFDTYITDSGRRLHKQMGGHWISR